MTLPAPLTPPDCDLRGYDFMPLFGHRLFRSDLYEQTDGEEFKCAVKLWWEAWNQCPAGSLPDDDAKLARLADLGRDVKTWRKIRESVLRGFVLCSDGRLYHKWLCEWALEAWQRRLRERAKKQKWRDGRGVGETEWLRLRAQVFERDGYQCVKCGSTDNLHCDHIQPVTKGGESSVDNLQTLCRPCNSAKKDKYGGHDGGVPPNGGGQSQLVHRDNGGGQSGNVPPLSLARGEERTGQERRGEESKERLKDSGGTELARAEPPSDPPVGQAAAQSVVVALRKAMRPTAYAPGWKPRRSPDEQAEAVAKPVVKARHLTPEQLAIVRKRATQ